MPDISIADWLRQKYDAMRPLLNERSRRIWAATEAASLGRGGIAAAMSATGMSSATVHRGLRELGHADAADEGQGRVRRSGGGHKGMEQSQPGFGKALAALVEDSTRGDPERPLRWTCKSTAKLSRQLRVRQ